jgi:transcriptional regulator with XRE-family HTH domain
MQIDPQAVSERIDWLRKQNGLSQEELAVALQVSQPAVSKYLRSRVPPAGTLLRLAQLGRTTIEWILTGQKSCPFGETPAEVHEPGTVYDADWQITQKIAALPLPLKEAVMRIVDKLVEKKKEDNATIYAAE